ncbi:MAG: hypothetical protein ACYC9J_06285 [Sulfuricaulis sp.]
MNKASNSKKDFYQQGTTAGHTAQRCDGLRGDLTNARKVNATMKMANYGASPGAICSVLGIPAKRKIRDMVNQTHPKLYTRAGMEICQGKRVRGRNIYSPTWYLRESERMVHGAYLIKILNSYAKDHGIVEEGVDLAERMISAYETYLVFVGAESDSAIITFTRFNGLRVLLKIGELVFRRCSHIKCGCDYLEAASTTRETCQICHETNEIEKKI